MADSPAIDTIANAVDKTQPGSKQSVHDFLQGLVQSPTSAEQWKTYSTAPSGITGQFAGLGVAGVGSGVAQLLAPSFSAITADATGISILGKKVFDFPLPKYVDSVISKSPKLKAFVDSHTREDPAITGIKNLIGDLGGKSVAATFGALGPRNVEGHLRDLDTRIGSFPNGKSVAETIGPLGTANVSGHLAAIDQKFGNLGAESVKQHLVLLGDQLTAIKKRADASRGKLAGEAQKIGTLQADRDPKRIKGPQYDFSQAQIDSLEKSIKLLSEAIGI